MLYNTYMENMFSEGTSPSSPKMFDLVVIKAIEASKLNALWHSRLPVIPWSNIVRNRNYVCYGAMYDYRYFAVGIWSSPVNRYLDPDAVLELRRLAISYECPKFTATWMIGKMIKDISKRFPGINKLISYQDTEVHTGTIYKAANWKNVCIAGTGNWESRDRNKPQSNSLKNRWEYDIN